MLLTTASDDRASGGAVLRSFWILDLQFSKAFLDSRESGTRRERLSRERQSCVLAGVLAFCLAFWRSTGVLAFCLAFWLAFSGAGVLAWRSGVLAF